MVNSIKQKTLADTPPSFDPNKTLSFDFNHPYLIIYIFFFGQIYDRLL